MKPDSPDAHTYRLDEVRDTSQRAREAGCREALFCLGDKPEVAYRGYRGWLQAQGYATTSEYLVDACEVAFEAGLFPHTNAGIMDADELRALRPWNASMGLMLETTSERLRQKGEAHYYCPDKAPRLRIEMTIRPGRTRSISSRSAWPTSAAHSSPVAGSNENRHGFRSPYAHISSRAPATPTKGLSAGTRPSSWIR